MKRGGKSGQKTTTQNKKATPKDGFFDLLSGGASRSRTDLHGFAIRCITALLSRQKHWQKRESHCFPFFRISGAGDEARTRDLNLGKVALYQLSYSRIVTGTKSIQWSGRRGSNSRPQPWQGCALPTELLPHCFAAVLQRGAHYGRATWVCQHLFLKKTEKRCFT